MGDDRHVDDIEQYERAVDTLTTVQEATTDPELTVERKVEQMLEIATDRLGFPIGYVARIEAGSQEIVAAVGDHEHIRTGATDPLYRTYCRKTIGEDGPFLVENAPEEGWGDDPAFERFGLWFYLGVRITVDDETYGTLCFADEEPREGLAFDLHDAIIATLARHIGYEFERSRYERELEQSRARLRTMFEHAPDPIFLFDDEGNVLDVNERAIETLGYTREELRSLNVTDIETRIDRETLDDSCKLSSIDDPLAFEGHPRREDGSSYPAEVWVNDIDLDNERRYIAIVRDISDRRERERELERQNERLEQFASIVSHDLRNPLNVAQGRLELLRQEYDGPHVDAIERAHDRMASLIDDLLGLAREGGPITDVDPLSLPDVVEECWKSVTAADAQLVVETDSVIRASEPQLRRLFENLFRNAVEHAGEDVTVTVGDLEEGFYVADDGPGIPEDERELVFEAGYAVGNGTGLGLNIVGDIVGKHGWDITLTGSTDGGTRFEISGVESA